MSGSQRELEAEPELEPRVLDPQAREFWTSFSSGLPGKSCSRRLCSQVGEFYLPCRQAGEEEAPLVPTDATSLKKSGQDFIIKAR